jgi:hypothetical protein
MLLLKRNCRGALAVATIITLAGAVDQSNGRLTLSRSENRIASKVGRGESV